MNDDLIVGDNVGNGVAFIVGCLLTVAVLLLAAVFFIRRSHRTADLKRRREARQAYLAQQGQQPATPRRTIYEESIATINRASRPQAETRGTKV